MSRGNGCRTGAMLTCGEGKGRESGPSESITDVRAPGIRCRWAVAWDAMMVLENGADLASKLTLPPKNVSQG